MAAQLLEALAHAHRRGIVHRDVKPSNVLLAETSAAIDVRLLDFGLAQMAEFDTLTARGDVPGTLAYVSPERLHGHEATEAADVWAVGVMLWEALARTPSVQGRDDGRDAVAHPRRPGAARSRAAGPAPSLHAAVASALVLDPARRPSAERLADELRSRPGKRRVRREALDRPAACRPASWP